MVNFKVGDKVIVKEDAKVWNKEALNKILTITYVYEKSNAHNPEGVPIYILNHNEFTYNFREHELRKPTKKDKQRLFVNHL